MKCAWKELLGVLPPHIRSEADKPGFEYIQEIRLRLGRPPELILRTGSICLKGMVDIGDLNFVINTASKYSPWSADTVRHGYITATGGHRIGLCGDCVTQHGVITGIKNITSVCIRVAKDIAGIAPQLKPEQGSLLIIGPPGSGKTTMLRDIIRQISEKETVALVDERREVFPLGCGFSLGRKLDVLTNCTKKQGIHMALRSMGPSYIAVDEITAQEDCDAMLHAGWCGVKLLATAHAADKQDLLNRPVYAPLAQSGIFESLLILKPDKSWKLERMRL